MRRTLPFILSAALLAACNPTSPVVGGASTGDVRFVNLVVDAPTIDVRALGVDEITALPFGEVSAVVPVNVAATSFETRNTSDGFVIGTDSVNLDPGVAYTYYALGKLTSFKPVLATDGTTFADSGTYKVRFVHGISTRTGPLDLYVTGVNDTITSLTPLISGTTLGTASAYFVADTAFRRVRLTITGLKTVLFDTTFATAIPDSTVLTLVATDQQGGAEPIRLQGVVDRAP